LDKERQQKSMRLPSVDNSMKYWYNLNGNLKIIPASKHLGDMVCLF
jgi:hypothetical protein